MYILQITSNILCQANSDVGSAYDAALTFLFPLNIIVGISTLRTILYVGIFVRVLLLVWDSVRCEILVAVQHIKLLTGRSLLWVVWFHSGRRRPRLVYHVLDVIHSFQYFLALLSRPE